jgi:hypothetical protein
MYYPVGIFFCDRPSLTPSDKKLGRGAKVTLLRFEKVKGCKKGQKGKLEISKIP